MAKEITCKVERLFCTTDETDYGDTRLAELSWNGRKCRGVDIRKYDKNNDSYMKGITLSYDGLTDIVIAAVENGLVHIDDVKKAIAERESNLFDDDDYDKLFKSYKNDVDNYKRDKFGRMVSKDGSKFVIKDKKFK